MLLEVFFKGKDKKYEHKPEIVLKKEDCRVFWYFCIQTEHEMAARRPNLIVVDKNYRTYKIIDFAVSGDCETEDKEI